MNEEAMTHVGSQCHREKKLDGKSSWYPLNRRFDGPQNWSGGSLEKRKIDYPHWKWYLSSSIVHPVAQSLY